MNLRTSADNSEHSVPFSVSIGVVEPSPLPRLNGRAVNESTTKERVWHALNQLTRQDLLGLAKFAQNRLRQAGLVGTSSEDLVQRALHRVIAGATGRGGRHPRLIDLAESAAFLNYLRGVIRSLVDTQRDLQENQFAHQTWEDDLAGGQTAEMTIGTINRELEFRDLVAVLHSRLKDRVPTRLHKILRDWKAQQFDSDTIPLGGQHRRFRAELRTFAATVLNEITRAEPIPSDHVQPTQNKSIHE